jgi:hypothetical protein
MAFRASTATQAQGLLSAMQQAVWVKQQAQAGITMLQGNVNANQIFQLLDNLRAPMGIFSSVAAIPGIATYAQSQFNDATYNVAAEFTSMTSALQAVIDWVVNNFPKGTGGFVQAYTINADGSRTPTVFTPAQTAGLTTALNAVVASII